MPRFHLFVPILDAAPPLPAARTSSPGLVTALRMGGYRAIGTYATERAETPLADLPWHGEGLAIDLATGDVYSAREDGFALAGSLFTLLGFPEPSRGPDRSHAVRFTFANPHLGSAVITASLNTDAAITDEVVDGGPIMLTRSDLTTVVVAALMAMGHFLVDGQSGQRRAVPNRRDIASVLPGIALD